MFCRIHDVAASATSRNSWTEFQNNKPTTRARSPAVLEESRARIQIASLFLWSNKFGSLQRGGNRAFRYTEPASQTEFNLVNIPAFYY